MCYARATVARARFSAAAFSDGSYLAHVNGAYLRHVKFGIVRGPPLFIVSPICQRGPVPTLTVPGCSKVHDGDVEGVEQTCRGTLASLIYTTIGDACVCVCVCKIGPISARTLSFRHQTSRKFFHIATFPSPTFGPLFAFHCPLFFLRKTIIYMPRCFEK